MNSVQKNSNLRSFIVKDGNKTIEISGSENMPLWVLAEYAYEKFNVDKTKHYLCGKENHMEISSKGSICVKCNNKVCKCVKMLKDIDNKCSLELRCMSPFCCHRYKDVVDFLYV